MQVKNSVAVITGAASGIGEASAIALAAAGAKVVLGDMNEEKLNAVKEVIENSGGIAAATLVNVTEESSVQSLMDFAIEKFGCINVVLACAGITRDSFFITPDKETGKIKKFMTTEQWKQVIDVNMTGVFLTLREAAIRMTDNKWEGVLIPISSINKSGELGQLNYASTKAAIALWPKILAGEFHARGIKNIRIAAIAPGYVETPLLTSIKPEILQGILNEIPVGRLVKTDEIAATIRFIIENEAVHGTTLEVSGGIVGKGLAK
ncbi:SDR family oxidoreductase [Terrimonas pollutisoli]|uniref:SDR family oxidoreductase n=1 Tax=Terrimonas pollutisoli TaxID=3034147 RepID=UPI0023EA7DF0|nr:SDR family oxidoreductase [Terrimonas sp. H1YJ31]